MSVRGPECNYVYFQRVSLARSGRRHLPGARRGLQKCVGAVLKRLNDLRHVHDLRTRESMRVNAAAREGDRNGAARQSRTGSLAWAWYAWYGKWTSIPRILYV